MYTGEYGFAWSNHETHSPADILRKKIFSLLKNHLNLFAASDITAFYTAHRFAEFHKKITRPPEIMQSNNLHAA
jgi:hypothetical protein